MHQKRFFENSRKEVANVVTVKVLVESELMTALELA